MELSRHSLSLLRPYYPALFLDYVEKNECLKHWTQQVFPTEEQIRLKAQRRIEHTTAEDRQRLSRVLAWQYRSLEHSKQTEENINKLKASDTLTLCTGQQLHPFGGPLYVLYKVLTLLTLTRELQKILPQQHLVPIFWMASEDHDADEIRTVRLFGKKFVWDTPQAGPVGQFRVEGLSKMFQHMSLPSPFKEAYASETTMSETARYIFHTLFRHEGLLVLDPMHEDLKESFLPFFKDDVEKKITFARTNKGASALVRAGHAAPIKPMTCNTFVIEKGKRQRLTGKLTKIPTVRLSPNVFLRTLYQEHILPNIAYVGGPTEIGYWLQCQPLFEHYHMDMPVLVPRYVGGVLPKKWLPKDKNQLFYTKPTPSSKLNPETTDNLARINQLNALFEEVKKSSTSSSTRAYVTRKQKETLALWKKMMKQLEKDSGTEDDIQLRRWKKARERLFPHGHLLQERNESLLSLYLNHTEAIPYLLEHMQPLSPFAFHLLSV